HITLIVLLVVRTALAADNPVTGTWRIDASKSSFSDGTFPTNMSITIDLRFSADETPISLGERHEQGEADRPRLYGEARLEALSVGGQSPVKSGRRPAAERARIRSLGDEGWRRARERHLRTSFRRQAFRTPWSC